ncbi:DNA cytosine methyltransferase [Streptococcus agalactiae]|nr:DNA cytosine methyltransferase [Streptococcus agalactiae]MCC9987393.1 DNA cytosine methyltransferase [Streptococcus agalactiae]MCD0020358.1 DNA cytosine methyltransferase [Streptococcus agalactiae]HEN0625667.1 DNA cytosine methyltransferase [Streptococcus agalactiae]HEN9894173.1 DNA cytosine methyltransferase [Streptococcus agalactiae]
MSKLEQSSRCIVITHLMLIMGMERQGHTCIGFCEIDKFARESYQAIFETEGELEYHDITRITDDQLRQFFTSVLLNPLTWLVSGFLFFLFLIVAFFLGYVSQSLVQQDEFALTQVYIHMTWEDSEHTRTNGEGITYYTKVD